MEVDSFIVGVKPIGETKDGVDANLDVLENCVDKISVNLDRLEKQVAEVEELYSRACRTQLHSSTGGAILQDKENEKFIASIKKQNPDAARREAAAAKRKQKLLGHLSTALHQMIKSTINQDEWTEPFLHPVDAQSLGLPDYYEPMDLSTIISKMESKDGGGYKNVRDMHADVKFVFDNAMKYNGKDTHVHQLAEALMGKIEEKWLRLLPKVVEEEKRREQEGLDVVLSSKIPLEARHTKMARDINHELCEVESLLKALRETVLQSCRKMSSQEKRKLGASLMHLSHEDLNKALQIVAQNNPSFQLTGEEIDLDIDAQDEFTLWSLRLFVKGAVEAQAKTYGNLDEGNHNANNAVKRKNECSDALVKTSNKKRSVLPS